MLLSQNKNITLYILVQIQIFFNSNEKLLLDVNYIIEQIDMLSEQRYNVLRRCIQNENDISAKKEIKKKRAWLQKKNENG